MKILSIDGGGTRGIIPATILRRLTEQTQEHPAEIFDVIAGSATGGVLAMGLACGLPAATIADLYRDEAAVIFARPWRRRVRTLGVLAGPRYDAGPLRAALVRSFGETRTLGDVHRDRRAVFLVPALDLDPYDTSTLGTPEPANMRPVVYDSSAPEHASLSVVEVAMRTAAAPMFFPIHGQYVEGGTVANNPAMIALTWALSRANDAGELLRQVRLLSLGCGTPGFARASREDIGDGQWGLLRWKDYLQHLVIETNMGSTLWHLEQLLPKSQWLRIHPVLRGEQIPEVIRDRPLRLDVKDPAELDALERVGDRAFQANRRRIVELTGRRVDRRMDRVLTAS